MARPIKETPVLTGKDAEKFMKKLENVEPASEEERVDAKVAYEKFKAIASFPL